MLSLRFNVLILDHHVHHPGIVLIAFRYDSACKFEMAMSKSVPEIHLSIRGGV
jgi:hypothetical protein